jgi:anti-sigma B factor antagonist
MPSRARVVVVTMPAEIDVTNADRIGGELSAAIASGAGIVVADMTGTRFCNSSGISMLVLAHRQAAANGAELRLVVLSAAVLRALKLVRMDCLLPIYPSLDAALTSEAGPEPELPACVPAAAGAPQPFLTEVVAFPGRRGRVHP